MNFQVGIDYWLGFPVDEKNRGLGPRQVRGSGTRFRARNVRARKLRASQKVGPQPMRSSGLNLGIVRSQLDGFAKTESCMKASFHGDR